MKTMQKKISGFNLVELAIVLVIIGLMMSTFLTPLTVQKDVKDYEKVKTDFAIIKESLYGYAILNGKLPCPDTNQDGLEDTCSTGYSLGDLPWSTLGIEKNDPWNRTYKYGVSENFSSTINLSNYTGNINIYSDSGLSKKVGSNVPAVIYSLGKNGATSPPTSNEEQKNTDGDASFVSHELTPTFDDALVWISANVLFNRMVSAQKLP